MVVLDYNKFGGRHPETGSIANILNHYEWPISEAMLLGLSGGIVVMYFVFDYSGHHPHLYLGTRNTFEPVETMCQRLGEICVEVKTSSPSKATDALIASLKDGVPAVVWASPHHLPYNGLKPIEFSYMQPLVVYGYEDIAKVFYVADRSAHPLAVQPEDLAAARAAVGSVKNRMLTIPTDAQMPDLSKPIKESIKQTIKLFTGKPPRGPASNFGLSALEKWAKMLTHQKNARGWSVLFPRGPQMYAALKQVFEAIETRDQGGGASRPLYADFLDEAGELLENEKLAGVADKFRASAKKWTELAEAALPGDVALLAETRQLIRKKRDLFVDQGQDGVEEIQEINTRLNAIASEIKDSPALTESRANELRVDLHERVVDVFEAETDAVDALKDAM